MRADCRPYRLPVITVLFVDAVVRRKRGNATTASDGLNRRHDSLQLRAPLSYFAGGRLYLPSCAWKALPRGRPLELTGPAIPARELLEDGVDARR